MLEMINLYSDTQTLPTEEMYEAIRSASLGDDVMGLDPTVNKLEVMAAEIFGKEAAMLVASGTMGNLCGLMALANPGDEVMLDPDAHIWYYEAGAFCSIGGLTPRPVSSHKGLFDPDEVLAAIRPKNLHMPIPRVLSLENTHNRSGGRVVPIDLHRKLCNIVHEHDMFVHLDGARIFNAQVASGVAVAEYAKSVDFLTFCLSKGLSCPVGSILVGDRDFIERARRIRKRLGGAMRQAGIIAAAGIVALTTMIDRLAEDHENARVLARGISEIKSLKVNMEQVETNFVFADCDGIGMTARELARRFRDAGVMVSTMGSATIRFVIHRHISAEHIKEALRRIKSVLRS